MFILVFGVSLFCTAFLIHIIVWKIKLPKKQSKWLLIIFFSTLLAADILFKSILNIQEFNFIQYNLLYISIFLAYFVTYPALEVDSPTLIMVIKIADTGQKGLDCKYFNRAMSDDILIKPRIRDLVNDKLIYLHNDKYKLTFAGLFFIHTIIFYRKISHSTNKGG